MTKKREKGEDISTYTANLIQKCIDEKWSATDVLEIIDKDFNCTSLSQGDEILSDLNKRWDSIHSPEDLSQTLREITEKYLKE